MGELEELYKLLDQLQTEKNKKQIEEIKKYVETRETRKGLRSS